MQQAGPILHFTRLPDEVIYVHSSVGIQVAPRRDTGKVLIIALAPDHRRVVAAETERRHKKLFFLRSAGVLKSARMREFAATPPATAI